MKIISPKEVIQVDSSFTRDLITLPVLRDCGCSIDCPGGQCPECDQNKSEVKYQK